MSENRDNGGPAFPIPGLHNDADFNGMSLRDYFAGQALASSFSEAVRLIPSKMTATEYAESMFGIADAMLAARNQKGAA